MMLTDTQRMVQAIYKDQQGNPILLTHTQDLIFSAIAKRKYPRMHIMCHTRYGKSLTVGLAVLTRVATFPEKWAIIAGSKPKAKIIMDYIIQHIFDNDFVQSRFVAEKTASRVEDIKMYRNKNHVSFRIKKTSDPITGKEVWLYGEVFVGSAADALGFGAPYVVEDEAALIDDNDHSLVTRMIGDNPNDNALIKIGNPFRRNHFLASYHDPKYKKYVVDCYHSLKEGRISQDIIEENRPYSFFKILYGCEFPSASEIDDSGWQYLLVDLDIKTAQERNVQSYGKRRLGHDVARGGRNSNSWCLRTDNRAEILAKDHSDDLIRTGDRTIDFMRTQGVQPEDVCIDDTGVGGGETDYLKSKGLNINPVKLGGSAENNVDYLNVRAEIYAGDQGAANWVKHGGLLVPHADWIELTKIRYRKNSQSKTVIEPKEDMLKRGVESPDVADSFALTFANSINSKYYGVDPSIILSRGVSY